MSVRVSIVVPTYRRRDLLLRCLEALAGQDYDAQNYEIIVADDENSAETRRTVELWAATVRPLVRYLPIADSHGPAAARNAGWRAAAGEIIAFTDDDCIPQPGWLSAGIAAIDAGADAAWGKLEMPLPPSPTDYELDASGLARSVFVTANCFCRPDALEMVGGFDERFTAAWREDSDLYFSLLERERAVVEAPDALVVHPIRPAPWGISVKQQAKSRFDVLLARKHPALYAQRIAPFPALYYAIAASLVATAVGVVILQPAVGLAGAAVWSGLTLYFCCQRLRPTSKAPSHVAEMAVTSAVIPPLSLYWRLRGLLQYGTVKSKWGNRSLGRLVNAPAARAETIGLFEHETA